MTNEERIAFVREHVHRVAYYSATREDETEDDIVRAIVDRWETDLQDLRDQPPLRRTSPDFP